MKKFILSLFLSAVVLIALAACTGAASKASTAETGVAATTEASAPTPAQTSAANSRAALQVQFRPHASAFTHSPTPDTGRGGWGGTPLEDWTDEQLQSSIRDLTAMQQISQKHIDDIDVTLEERAAGTRSIVPVSEGSFAGNSHEHLADDALLEMSRVEAQQLETFQTMIDRYSAELAERGLESSALCA